MKISDNFTYVPYDIFSFVNCDIDKDNLYFFDGNFIESNDNLISKECLKYIDSYFNRLYNALKNGKKNEALELLKNLQEVNDVCFGYSSDKPRGNGMGKKVNEDLYEGLLNLLKDAKDDKVFNIEEYRLCCERVGRDRISDMIANIIKEPLMKYTDEQCKLFGVDNVIKVKKIYWSKETNNWEKGEFSLPQVNNRSIILVPKILLSYHDFNSEKTFLTQVVLTQLIADQIKNDPDFSLIQYKKSGEPWINKSLYRKYLANKGIILNKAFAKEKIFEDKNWLNEFNLYNKNYINKKWNKCYLQQPREPEIYDYVSTLIESNTQLSKKILFAFEFLFYPHLSLIRKDEKSEGLYNILVCYSNELKKAFRIDNIGEMSYIINSEEYNGNLEELVKGLDANKKWFIFVIDNKDKSFDFGDKLSFYNHIIIIHLNSSQLNELLDSKRKKNNIINLLPIYKKAF